MAARRLPVENMVSMMYVDDDPPRPPAEGQQWACGPFGFWPLTFPWGDGVSWDLPFTPAAPGWLP